MTGTHRAGAPGFTSSQASRRPRRMLRRGTALSGLAAAAVLVAACGSPSGSTASPGAGGNAASPGGGGNAPAADRVVSTRQLGGIGTVLVDSSGMTIYTPKQPQEAVGKIRCTGSCLSFWLPVTASSASPGRDGAARQARHDPPPRRQDPAHLQRQAAVHVPPRHRGRPGARQQLPRQLRRHLLHLAGRDRQRKGGRGRRPGALARLQLPAWLLIGPATPAAGDGRERPAARDNRRPARLRRETDESLMRRVAR